MLTRMIDSVSETAGAAADLKKARRRKNVSTSDPIKLDRLPPHALDMEQGVLGCQLLSPNECVGEVIEKLKGIGVEAHYDLRHQTIQTELFEMFDTRVPIDVITLQQRLKDKKLLEQVGGIAYLSQLQDAVPSAANLSYYLDIVREKYLLRKMIQTCTEVVGRVYDYEGEVDALLDEVERDVLRISESRSQSDALTTKDLVGKAIHTIENFFSRQGALTGLATGFVDLDRMTDGLHGSEMIVVAARPSMGKTSLAMNIVEHVVLEDKLPAAVFSLEMSAEALVLRMMCSIARVNLRSIREGFMSESDFPKLTSAAGRLANAPLFIDDSAGLSILQLRARARRLHQMHGVKLFVVDYLQLLHSTARRFQENRQQEISDISSGLKALAKELKAPVLVLSQLNRELERDKSRKPRLSDLRECVTGDTLVCLSDGRRIPIQELVGTTPKVLCVSPDGRIVSAKSEKIWEVGRRKIYTVRLASGREIRATAQHRLLGAEGWRRIDQLQNGDRLAIARVLPELTKKQIWPDARLELLGQLIGDGSYLVHQPLRYTTSSLENSAAVAGAARQEFGAKVKRYAGRGKWHQLLISGNGNRWQPAGVNKWLRVLEVYGQRSYEKRIPRDMFRLSNRQTCTLLRHLWATDGSINTRNANLRGGNRVYFATNSSGLASDVAALLLRLGIVARIRKVDQKPKYRPMFTVDVSGADDQRRFLEKVGAFGPRLNRARQLSRKLSATISNTNVDTLPRECFTRVKLLMRRQGISQRRMATMRGTSYGGSSHFRFAPSRVMLAEYADILKDDVLQKQATNDLFWDRIVSIEASGEEIVFDLTVPKFESWLADGIVSHNSGAIEQDADLVGLLYKPSAGDDEDGNTEEADGLPVNLLIAKQRNGPTGDINLTFLKSYTRFESAAKVSDEDVPTG